ncbi:FAD-dependent monooxygenase [uncultured Tateyamaria sp.]|uniref:FAD-dependent monooxygenase n=1 Tax=uncultured Tateyamaria sp. TaxID=455651 RepID=UPI0026372850|nr:FAD-dependent monooxygenase [uncultured Tateyamaria sp.]
MKALIAGGGIGGLASAIALSLRGWEVAVCEQAPALSEIGAGLQISPNGWRVLAALGVAEALKETLFEPEAIEMRMGQGGGRVFRLPMRGYAQARWGAPYIHIHRADLVAALEQRLLDLQADAILTGQVVSGYDQSDTEARLIMGDGSTQTGDIVIGADGLHSVIRAQLLGPDHPRYTGNVAWRAVVPLDRLGDHAPPPSACVWVGHKRHAVTTRLRRGTLANFVGMVETPEPAPESWRATGSRADAQAAFKDWAPEISTLIDHADALHRWALFDRAPLRRWHEGRVALLGDAAHPMLPSMAQGAVQALEDAWVLAEMLERHATPEAGFAAYFSTRITRTSRVQKGSAANARLFHHANALGRWAFYRPMGLAAGLAPNAFHARQDWVYGFDATAP